MARFLIAFLIPVLLVAADDGSGTSQNEEENTKLICPDGEIANDCPYDCPEYCPKNEKEAQEQKKCRQTTSYNCKPPRCTCYINDRRAENGTCIDVKDCPPFDCSSLPNQHYDPCPFTCPGETCASATPDGKCHLPGHLPFLICYPACHCDMNFWRKNGVCVSYSECGKDATEKPEPTERPTTEKAPPCVSTPVCGINEEYDCRNISCDRDLCASIVSKFACAENEVCTSGCFCKRGLYREKAGMPCKNACKCSVMRNSPDCKHAMVDDSPPPTYESP